MMQTTLDDWLNLSVGQFFKLKVYLAVIQFLRPRFSLDGGIRNIVLESFSRFLLTLPVRIRHALVD